MGNLAAHQALLSSGQGMQLSRLTTTHTLLIVGTKIAKSDPSWMTKEHMVSRTAIRISLLDDSNTRTRGWIIREAWSEKLTLLDNPSMVWMAFFRKAVAPSGHS